MAVPMLFSEDSYRPIRMMKTSIFPPREARGLLAKQRRNPAPSDSSPTPEGPANPIVKSLFRHSSMSSAAGRFPFRCA